MFLHEKYRPSSLNEIVGNDSIVQSLYTILERTEDRPHSYLFTGESGSGKTTISRILANEFGCSSIFELNISDATGVDAARKIIDDVNYLPLGGGSKAYILDECHRASGNFFDALLKVVEKPPKHCYFFFCTTEEKKIPRTIKTRCIQYKTELLSPGELKLLLNRVLKSEGIDKIPKEATKELIEQSGGSARELLTLLDKVIDLPDEEMIASLKSFKEFESNVIDLCRTLLKTNNWDDVRKVLVGLQQQEPEKIRRAVLTYMMKVLLNNDNLRAAEIINEFKSPFYDSGFPGIVLACYSCLQ